MIIGLLRQGHRKRPIIKSAAYKPGSVGRYSSSGRSFLLGYDCSDPPAAYPRCLHRGGTTPHRLFGLAPAGVYRAIRVATYAVSSYLAVSPLPDPACGWPSAVCSLWHFPSSHDAQTLSGGSSYGARTFLGTCGCHSYRDRPAAHSGNITCCGGPSNW